MAVIQGDTSTSTEGTVTIPGLNLDARIATMNAANVAAQLSTGDSDSYEENLRLVIKSHKKLGLL